MPQRIETRRALRASLGIRYPTARPWASAAPWGFLQIPGGSRRQSLRSQVVSFFAQLLSQVHPSARRRENQSPFEMHGQRGRLEESNPARPLRPS